jgi:hypothetical protein
MIIKGKAAGAAGWWGKHLMRDDKNSRVEVIEISGLLSENVPAALREMAAIAAQSRSEGNFMYAAHIDPLAHEHLTPGQWLEAVNLLEKNMQLEGHQRVVVEHEKNGRTHQHIIWNRVDVETLRVTDIGGNYYTHERTARELEERFGLSHTASLHGQQREEGRPDRPPELWEQRAAERSGIDPKAVKAELSELWRTTDSGKAFAAALEEHGYILAAGDRRGFCIVDQVGDAHSLARRLDGVKAKEVAERLSGIDRASLPTVDEARETQRSRPQELASGEQMAAAAERNDLRAGIRATEAELVEARTDHAAQATPSMLEALREHRSHIAQAVDQQAPAAVPAALWFGLADQRALDTAKREQQKLEPTRPAEPEQGMTGQLPEDIRKPAPIEQQRTQPADQPKPSPAKEIPQYQRTEALLPPRDGRSSVSFSYGQIPAVSAPPVKAAAPPIAREVAQAKTQETWSKSRDAEVARVTDAPAPKAKGGGFSVAGFAGSLGDFVLSLFGGSTPAPTQTPSQVEQIKAQRRAADALDNIRDSIERGEGLQPSDLKNLTPTHLQNIARQGDDYIRNLIERDERDRQRENDYGRERER